MQHLTLEQSEPASAVLEGEHYVLTLFVSGASGPSAQAIANLHGICDAHLRGQYQLSIVDLHQQPALAAQHYVLATPTLVKERPLPARMLVGDMSDHLRILVALDARVAGSPYTRPAEVVEQQANS